LPAGADDAIGYAAEGAGFFGVQYDPANFPLSKELMLLGLSEQAWADILASLRAGKGKTGDGFGFSKAIARCACCSPASAPAVGADRALCQTAGQTKTISSALERSPRMPSTAKAKRRWLCCR